MSHSIPPVCLLTEIVATNTGMLKTEDNWYQKEKKNKYKIWFQVVIMSQNKTEWDKELFRWEGRQLNQTKNVQVRKRERPQDCVILVRTDRHCQEYGIGGEDSEMKIEQVANLAEKKIQRDCQGDLLLYCIWTGEMRHQIAGIKKRC